MNRVDICFFLNIEPRAGFVCFAFVLFNDRFNLNILIRKFSHDFGEAASPKLVSFHFFFFIATVFSLSTFFHVFSSTEEIKKAWVCMILFHCTAHCVREMKKKKRRWVCVCVFLAFVPWMCGGVCLCAVRNFTCIFRKFASATKTITQFVVNGAPKWPNINNGILFYRIQND